MAKNIRRMLAMVLVMCMFVSALPMQALAAEGDEPIPQAEDSEGFTITDTFTGEDVNIEFTATSDTHQEISVSGTNSSGAKLQEFDGFSESKSDSYEDPNTGSTIQKDTTHVEISGTESGTVDKAVEYMEDQTVVTETAKDGTVTQQTIVDGLETKEWTENDTEEEQEVPAVKVELDPTKENTTGTASETYIEDVIDNVEGGSTVANSDKTTISTTVDREVSATFTQGVVVVKKDTDLTGAVKPEDYDGKKYSDTYNAANPQSNGLRKPEEYYKDLAGAGSTTDYNTEFYLSGQGEATDAAIPVFQKVVYQRYEEGDEIPEGYKVGDAIPKTYKEGDEIPEGYKVGDIIPNGGYELDEEKCTLLYKSDVKVATNYVKEATGMVYQPSQLVLKSEDGNKYFYTYCADYLVDADYEPGFWYEIENLEDSGHFSQEDAEKLRAIALNGYWGNESGTGSLENIKATLTAYAEKNPDLTVTIQDKNGNPETRKFSEVISGLTEAEALAVTQAAIWAYSVNRQELADGVDGVTVVGVQSAIKAYSTALNQQEQYSPAKDQSFSNFNYGDAYLDKEIFTDAEKAKREAEAIESDLRLKAFFDYLMDYLPGVSANDSGVTTVLNEKNFVKDMALVVNDKAEEKDENDIYNVDLQFKLDFDLSKDDRLNVRLTDAEGNSIKDAYGHDIVIEHALAVKDSGRENVLEPDDNGVYTLSGLKLSEGTDFSFNLTLEGTQELSTGAYLFTAEGGRKQSQTLIGLASGKQTVTVSAAHTLNFSVEETVTHKEERVWHNEFDPGETPPEETPVSPTPTTPPKEPVTPPTPPAEPAVVNYYEPPAPVALAARAAVWTAPENQRLANEDAVEIPEEPVPLANPAITGDDTGLWVMALMMIACCMVAINVFGKKRSHEAF